MIELTRLNGRTMILNSDLIKSAEASPDTMLTLVNGEKLIVRENISEVVDRVLAYRSRLLAVVARRMGQPGGIDRAGGIDRGGGIDRVAALISLPASPAALSPESQGAQK